MENNRMISLLRECDAAFHPVWYVSYRMAVPGISVLVHIGFPRRGRVIRLAFAASRARERSQHAFGHDLTAMFPLCTDAALPFYLNRSLFKPCIF